MGSIIPHMNDLSKCGRCRGNGLLYCVGKSHASDGKLVLHLSGPRFTPHFGDRPQKVHLSPAIKTASIMAGTKYRKSGRIHTGNDIPLPADASARKASHPQPIRHDTKSASMKPPTGRKNLLKMKSSISATPSQYTHGSDNIATTRPTPTVTK